MRSERLVTSRLLIYFFEKHGYHSFIPAYKHAFIQKKQGGAKVDLPYFKQRDKNKVQVRLLLGVNELMPANCSDWSLAQSMQVNGNHGNLKNKTFAQ